MTTDNQMDLNNGITMEVPYKLFSNPSAFWGLIRRNICVGINRSKTTFHAKNANDVQSALILTLNAFTGRAAFNARGLLKDSQVPGDEVYEQWLKSLRFYLTMTDGKAGVIKITLGIQQRDPWDGISITAVADVFTAFFLRDGMYNILPFVDQSQAETIVGAAPFQPIDIKPFHAWFHGSNAANGEVPSLLSKVKLLEHVKGYEEALRSRIDGIGGDSGVSDFGLSEQIERFDAWCGGSLFVKEASIYSRLVPIRENLAEIHTCFTARGDYEMNFYARILKV